MTVYVTGTHQTVIEVSGALEKLYAVDKVVADLVAAGVVTCTIANAAGATTSLWLDTNTAPGILKYHNGAAWVAMAPVGLFKHIHNNGFNNYSAVAAPAVGNDSTQGYAVGSMWFDTTGDVAYVCIDSSAGAAIWINVSKQGDFLANGTVPMTGDLDLDGHDLILDVDGNSKLNVTGNNTFQFEIGGANVFGFAAGGMTVPTGKTLSITDAPTAAAHAANKGYVDARVNGLSWKDSVNWATAGALPANTYANGTAGVGATLTATANGALSVDGNAVTAGERLLVKNEATGANNGIYTVTQAGTAGTPYILTRTVDADETADLENASVFIAGGATLADTMWTQNATVTTIGTTAQSWIQFSSAGSVLSFTTISTPAGTAPVADSATDTLTLSLEADSGLRITGNSGTDTIAFGLNMPGLGTMASGTVASADSFIIYDASASLHKTVTIGNLIAQGTVV